MLLEEINSFLVSGLLVLGHAGKLKGKLMFAASQLWGKVGRAFLLAISERQYSKSLGKDQKAQLGKALEHSLRNSSQRLLREVRRHVARGQVLGACSGAQCRYLY